MHPCLAEQLVLSSVVTRDDVLRWHSAHELRSMVERGSLVRVWRGVYSDDGPAPGLRTRLRGLDLALGEQVTACGVSAAELYGFAVDADARVHVAVPVPRALADRPGVRVHRGDVGPVVEVGERPVVAPAWAAVDTSRARRRPRALATLDAALRSGTCSHDHLLDAVDRRRGHRGVSAVRGLVGLADGLSESPMESETRLLLHDGGLPRPTLQHEVRTADGRLVARLDLAWPDHRVAVEYDGLEFHRDRRSLENDRRRAAELLGEGWRCLALTRADVRDRPERTVHQVRALLATRG
ncbi:type IV toxin-antitoxin system AbiEi family antitoxin domain-containing protein [Rhodococcus aerolatus]